MKLSWVSWEMLWDRPIYTTKCYRKVERLRFSWTKNNCTFNWQHKTRLPVSGSTYYCVCIRFCSFRSCHVMSLSPVYTWYDRTTQLRKIWFDLKWWCWRDTFACTNKQNCRILKQNTLLYSALGLWENHREYRDFGRNPWFFGNRRDFFSPRPCFSTESCTKSAHLTPNWLSK